MYSKKLLKSISTPNIRQSKRAASVAPSSLAGTKNHFKIREPTFAPLNKNYDFNKEILSKWKERRIKAPPKRRSFHTSLIFSNYLYIFGGKDITEGKLSDIMRLDLSTEETQWETVTPSNGICLEPLAFHTGTFVEGKYYIIGGNDKYLNQSSYVYIYEPENNTLEKIEIPLEEKICYISMHSANYYEATKDIILFGGYSSGEMLNSMFKFNVETKKITKVQYAGMEEPDENKEENAEENDQNENNDNYERDYELERQKQKKKNEPVSPEEPKPEPKNIPSPRTGHASFIKDDNFYVFGGILKDGTLLNDIWKFEFANSTWTKISPSEEIEKELLDPNNKNPYPSGRSGHSLISVPNSNEIYIFGGKIGILNESNDLWKYNISENKFTLIHDTMLEQFTAEEMEEFKRAEKLKEKEEKNKFHFITKKELDDRKNPFSRLYQNKRKNIKNSMMKSSSTQDINKYDYENEIFVNSGYYQMKHSSIFNLDNKGVSSAMNDLDTILPYKIGDKGIKLPLPRDGQSLDFYNNQLILFGGDRNKYPFNDLYIFQI